jgi:GNAT superfamily N-acetyltransferase
MAEQPLARFLPPGPHFSFSGGRHQGVGCRFYLKKEVEGRRSVHGMLRFELARGIKRPMFILTEYWFFREGEARAGALVIKLPWPLCPLSMMIHVLESHALALLEVPCYYVNLGKKTVGLFAYQESHDVMRVASLAVRSQWRRLGIGGFLLKQIEQTARHMHKQWLEVAVLRKNSPATRLYTGFGFTFQKRSGNRRIMIGRKQLKNV